MGAVAVSLSIVSPTLAVSLNPQAIAEEVGGAVPLVYLLALGPILLIAGAFAVLTSRFGSVDSVVGLLTTTVGPRAGAVSGFVLLTAYLMAIPGTLSAFGMFSQGLLARAFSEDLADWWFFPVGVIVLVASFLIARSAIKSVGNVLLSIEGLSVVGIVLVSLTALFVMVRGLGSADQRVELTDLSLTGVNLPAIGVALTFAVVSVAGFEAAAAVGESTDNAKRNIPRAVVGTAVGAILFYAGVAAVAVWAFDDPTREFGSLEAQLSLPVALADEFFGTWVGTLLLALAALTCLAGSIGACVAGSRMLVGLARGGRLPRGLLQRRVKSEEPERALAATAILGIVATAGCVALVGPNLFKVFELAGVTTGFLFLTVYAAVCAVAARVLLREGKLIRAGLMALGAVMALVIFAVTFFPLPEGWARWGPILALVAVIAAILLGSRGQRVRP